MATLFNFQQCSSSLTLRPIRRNIKRIAILVLIEIGIISIQSLGFVKGQTSSATCSVSNCGQCTTLQTCSQCSSPFILNSFGYCKASSVCQLNQYYDSTAKSCGLQCPPTYLENDVLNACEAVHNCSKTNSIGNYYLQADTSSPLYLDSSAGVYVQLSQTGLINIFDSSSLQFLAQITTSMKTISNSYYDPSTKEIIVTNTLGEIEIWDIMSASQIFVTSVQNQPSTSIYYFIQIKKFFFLNSANQIVVIDDFSQPPKILPYQLVSSSLNILYVPSSASLVFAGSQQELLHIKTSNYSVLYYNKYDTTLSTNAFFFYRSTIFAGEVVMFYYFNKPPAATVLYYPDTLKWIVSDDANPLVLGVFLDTVYMKAVTTTLQFYSVANNGKFTALGPTYSITPSFLVAYDNNTKVIALTLSASTAATAISTHYRYSLDITSQNIFTAQMFTNPVQFTGSFQTFLLLDESTRRLVVRSANGNINVIDLDSLVMVYSIKQFQQPIIQDPATFNYNIRFDPVNQSNVVVGAYGSIQNINQINNKRKFKFAGLTSYPSQIVEVKDFVLAAQGQSGIFAMSKSNMQLVSSISYTSTDSCLTRKIITFPTQNNNLITICKQKIITQIYNDATLSYSQGFSYNLSYANDTFSELTDDIVVCAITKCFQFPKSNVSNPSTISFLTDTTGIFTINSQSSQNFFTIVNNLLLTYIFSYPSFSQQLTIQMPGPCFSVITQDYLSSTSQIFACQPTSDSIAVVFYILQYNPSSSPPTATFQSLRIEQLSTGFIFLSPQYFISYYLYTPVLIVYVYGFTANYSEVFEKAQLQLSFPFSKIVPTYDFYNKRLYFSYNSQVYAGSTFIGDIEDWSFQIQPRYYDQLDNLDTSNIQQLKKCSQGYPVYGIVRVGSVFIVDAMSNQTYKFYVPNVTDIFIDSTQSAVFYLVDKSYTLYCYNYVLGVLAYSYPSTVMMTNFTEITNPTFVRTFLTLNKYGLDISFCQYQATLQGVTCYPYSLTANGNTIASLTSCQNALVLIDSKSNYYFFQVNPTSPINQYSLIFSSQSSTSVGFLIPKICYFIVQAVNYRSGYLMNNNYLQQISLSQNCQIVDIIPSGDGYYMICIQAIYLLNSAYSTVSSFSLNMNIKIAYYYAKNNAFLVVSSQQPYQNMIALYDMNTQLQLQSIQVGSYPLQNILYVSEEDIFVVYNIYGQIFRVNLNNKGNYIVNTFTSDLGSQTNNFLPIIFNNKKLNTYYFASINTFYQWHYSPFVGERMDMKRIRYNQFISQQNKQNPDIVYYCDVQGFIWQFQLSSQKYLTKGPSDIQDMYSTNEILLIFYYSNYQIYKISDLSNTLLVSNTVTVSIQMSLQIDSFRFLYFDQNLSLYLLDITQNVNNTPTLVGTFQYSPLDFLQIDTNNILISLIGQPPVLYSLLSNTIKSTSGYPKLKTFIGMQTLTSEPSIIIIEEKNIIKISSVDLSIISILNFPTLDTAGFIESYAFDDKQQQLYIHYTLQSYAYIVPLSMDSTQIVSVGCCDTTKVKFLVLDSYVAIYCIFQVNFHKRNAGLTYMYAFRQPQIVNSMYNLIILNDLFLIAIQQNNIQLFNMGTVSGNSRTFTLSRTIVSKRANIYQCLLNDSNQIKISGVGFDGYFNNLIYMGYACQNTFTSIKNTLSLKSQFNQINQSQDSSQNYFYFYLQLDKSASFSQLPYLQDLLYNNNNALISYVPSQVGSQLLINNSLFSNVNTIDFVLKDFKFVFSNNSSNITFNQLTQSVIFKRILISSNVTNASFYFSNLNTVVIDQLTILKVSISNSNLFIFSGVQNIVISNLKIIGSRFDSSQLIKVQNAKSLIISNLTMQATWFTNYDQQMFVNVVNTNSLLVNQFTISSVQGEDSSIDISTVDSVIERENTYLQSQVNHLFYVQKVTSVTFSNGNCTSLEKISLLKYENYYSDGILLSTLVHSSVTFNTVQLNSNSAMNSIVNADTSDITLISVTASRNVCSDCNGSVFLVFGSKNVIINQSTFILNQAIHGGALALINCNDVNNVINSSNFTSNTARGNGGAIYLETCNLDLNEVVLLKNSALIGGAIRYKNFVPILIAKILNSTSTTILQSNVGTIYGNNYGSYVSKFYFVLQENVVQIGNYISSNNTVESYQVVTFSSGDSFEPSFKFQDEEFNEVVFDPKVIGTSKSIPNSIRLDIQNIVLNLNSHADDILIEGPNFVSFSQFSTVTNAFVFAKLQLVSQPKKVGTLFIQTNPEFVVPSYFLSLLSNQSSRQRMLQKSQTVQSFSQMTQAQFTLQMQFNFRDCIRGEIYQNISSSKVSCYRCPQGTYSLDIPDFFQKQECTQCSTVTTKECGNDTIILQDGYWRSDWLSDTIVECSNRPENCKDMIGTKNYCLQGLIGPLCETCDVKGDVWGQRFSQTLEFQCAPCTQYIQTYLRWILIFVGINVYILGSFHIFLEIYKQKSIVYYMRQLRMICFGNSARRDESSTYLKFLITYAQLQSNINQFKYDIFVLSIPTIFGRPMSELNSATDCLVLDIQNVLVVKVTAMLLLPILFYLWICLVRLFMSIFQYREPGSYWKLARMKLFSLFLFSFTVFQPNIVQFLIQSVSCRVIGGDSFVASDLTIVCYSQEHITVILISIAGLLLWGLILPIYIFNELMKIEHTEWITTQYKFGFLYIEYKKDSIYWEIVKIYLKVLVVIYINLLKQNPITEFCCLAFTLFGYYYMVNFRHPYETNHMNQVDKNITISLSIQVLLNALNKDNDNSRKTQVLIQLIIIIINISTFVFLILVILMQKIKFIRQNMNKIKYSISKLKLLQKFKVFQNNIQIQNDMKRFIFWKYLSNNLQSAITECQRSKYNQLRELYLQRISQQQDSSLSNHNKSKTYMQKSKQIENIFKEFESITQQRLSLSTTQLGKRTFLKQNTAQITEEDFVTIDQVSELNATGGVTPLQLVKPRHSSLMLNKTPSGISLQNSTDKFSPYLSKDNQSRFFNQAYSDNSTQEFHSKMQIGKSKTPSGRKNVPTTQQSKLHNSKFSLMVNKSTLQNQNEDDKIYEESNPFELSSTLIYGGQQPSRLMELVKNNEALIQSDEIRDIPIIKGNGGSNLKYESVQNYPKIIDDEIVNNSSIGQKSQQNDLNQYLDVEDMVVSGGSGSSGRDSDGVSENQQNQQNDNDANINLHSQLGKYNKAFDTSVLKNSFSTKKQ